jgi:hypothetical protein
MKGGSVASNAVSGLVTNAAYNSLTKNFSNHTNSGSCATTTKGGSSKCGKCSTCCSKTGGSKKCNCTCASCAKCTRGTRGGSVASNAVSGLVTNAAYNSLTKNFSNHTNSGSCATTTKGGSRAKKVKKAIKSSSVRSSKISPKRGGDKDYFTSVSNAVVNAVSKAMTPATTSTSEGFNVFRSNAAPAGYEYANLRGNANSTDRMRPVSGGVFNAKNMSEYMKDSNTYNVKNRRGGNPDTATQIVKGLDYSAIQHTNRMQGDIISRETPQAVNLLMTSQNASSLPALDKHISYGSITDAASPFSYSSTNNFASANPTLQPVGGKKPKAKPKVKKVKKVKKASAPKK